MLLYADYRYFGSIQEIRAVEGRWRFTGASWSSARAVGLRHRCNLDTYTVHSDAHIHGGSTHSDARGNCGFAYSDAYICGSHTHSDAHGDGGFAHSDAHGYGYGYGY